MTTQLKLPQDRPPLLADLIESLGADALLGAAREIEALRADPPEAALLAHHRFAVPGLMTTPFMHQAAVVARERGIVAFDRLERSFLLPAPSWIHPEVGADYFRAEVRGDVFSGPSLWPLSQDCPVADYQLGLAPLSWSRALIRALVGFGWWPGLSEWDVMHMARLSEAVVSLHGYWLSELGRLDDDSPRLDLSRLDPREAALYQGLEEEARDPATRAARLSSDKAREIAANAMEVFAFEAFAYTYGVTHGVLIEPEPPSLAFAEASEYAKVHQPRLASPSFERWLEHCLRPEVDYATSAVGFDARAAEVLLSLLSPAAPSAEVGAARADRVLRDLGQRVCHLAALRGEPAAGFQPQLSAISEALATLRGGHDDPDGLVSEVLSRLAREIDQPAEGPGPKELLALGYSPLTDPAREPALAKACRAEALVNRAWAYQPVVGATLEGLKPLATRVVDAPRTARLTEELRVHADPAARDEAIDYFSEAWVGWIDFLDHHWGPADGRDNLAPRWQYRLSRRSLPPRETWSQFVVTTNPYLEKLPLAFNARWVSQLLEEPRGEIQPLRPRNQTAVEYCFVGPGRQRPLFAPLTPELQGLLVKVKLPLRLDTLIAHRDIDAERVAAALDDELILCFHKPEHPAPDWQKQQVDFIDWRAEPSEPEIDYWAEPRQVAAYEAFCDSSSLYQDASAALVASVGVGGADHVLDLGCGTGLTTLAALAQLGPEGLVVGADPSALMLERARVLVDDPRARFISGGAMELGVFSARAEHPFDKGLCNSALWLARDIKREAGRVRNAMAEGGVFGFSMPAAFLGHNDHLMTPEFARFGEAVVAAREALGHDPEAVPLSADPALGDLEHMREVLRICAFDDVDFQLWTHRWPVSEYIDWLSMPVVREGMVPPDKRHEAERFIALLRERLDPDMPLENRWYLVISRAA